MVLTRAANVSASSMIPSGWSARKSRSLSVGLDLARSWRDALRLYVLPFRSYFSCILIDDGRRLFITTNRMFLPPHCKTVKQRLKPKKYHTWHYHTQRHSRPCFSINKCIILFNFTTLQTTQRIKTKLQTHYITHIITSWNSDTAQPQIWTLTLTWLQNSIQLGTAP